MHVALLLAAVLATPQARPKPKVDQAAVDQAIQKGVAYLKGQLGKYGSLNKRRSEELLLWTFIHAGLPEGDPDVQSLLKTVLDTELQWTYNVSLQALILEEIDRVRFQPRVAQCAQFLVDNQCDNGQWSYGEPTPFVKDVATGGAKRPTSKGSTRVVKKMPILQKKKGPPKGDNSNSQYASLGMRACFDAGIVFPPDVLAKAEAWWRESLNDAGGWGYLKSSDTPYGSMTAGAAGALTIYLFMQGKPWMKDKEVVAGMEWMGKNFTVTANPASAEGWQYYFLYALERAGIFYGTEQIGGHEWYPEGAKYLLAEQKPDGAWLAKQSDHAIWDTCFAILFLRRATRPLIDVASTDARRK
jgi:hypothetical protein